MAPFAAPIDVASWTLTAAAPVVVPHELRYANTPLAALRAQRATPGPVSAPAAGVLRALAPATGPLAGRTVVEVQANPFAMRRVAQAIAFGAPTFYLVLDAGATLVPFAAGDIVGAGAPVATASGVTILCAGQDRIARDPALWSATIAAAIASVGSDAGSWPAFAAAVAAQTASGPDPPVLLLDHTGAPLVDADVELSAGAQSAAARLTAADGGDLQRAVARLHAADPGQMPFASVFGAGGPVRIGAAGGADLELTRLEDGAGASGSIEVTPALRHVTLTDLKTWFAPQYANAGLPAAFQPLADYTRGNRVTPFVNGLEYYADLLAKLKDAADAGAGGGLHLVGGWQTVVDAQLARRDDGATAAEHPVTLLEAVALLSDEGGAARVLSPQFFQFESQSTLQLAEIIIVSLLVMGLLRGASVSAIRSDAGGMVVLAVVFVANAALVPWIISVNGRPVEPNVDAVDELAALDRVESEFGPFPAHIEDNPLSPPLGGFPWDTLLTLQRSFGFYHQKFGVVKAGVNVYGYCGGIDINPNRLDDVRHVAPGPYHDVHARVEGPAARDVALSFEQRWSRDGTGPVAFATPQAADLGTPGDVAAQIARTYYRPASATRALPYAPNGDRTIADTLLRAIDAAREFIYIEDQYFTAAPEFQERLVGKVADREIGALVVVLPAIGDQPFGEMVRSGFIADLKAADAGAGIVRIGYPRRHYTVPDNDTRASSGRLVLQTPLPSSAGLNPTVVLGPKSRLPGPPFWVAIEGELMYVVNESTAPNPNPLTARIFDVVRGADTRLVKGGTAPLGAPDARAPRRRGGNRRRPGVHLRPCQVDDRRRRLPRDRLGEHQPPRPLPRRRDRGLRRAAAVEGVALEPRRRAAPPAVGGDARPPARDRRAAARGPDRRGPPVRPLAAGRQPLRGHRGLPDPPHAGRDGRRRPRPHAAEHRARLRDRGQRAGALRRRHRPHERAGARPVSQSLFDLFGDPGALWPADRVHEHTGHEAGTPSEVAAWLGRLNVAVAVRNVRTGARADRVSVEADLNATTFAGDPEGWPFVIASMPDVELRIKPFPTSGPAAKLFASAGDSGFELVLEGLPVEIRLPEGLIVPHPDEPGAPDGSLQITTGEFQPGRIDDLMVTLRRGGPTSIFVHVRILMTEAYEFHIQPAVPVSFGESALSGIPCTAIHDFRLIASPELAPDHIEWLRHPVEPISTELTGPYDGLFSVRTVDIDEEAEDMASVVEWFNGHAKDREPTAELVLDDLVVPFFSPFVLPFPVHLTAGLRRKVIDVTDPEQVFNFTRDPVHIVIREQHKLALNVASFFYRSTPYAQLDDRFLPTKPAFPTADGWDDPGLTFGAALVFGEESPAPSFDSDGPQQAITFGLEENLTIVLGYKRSFDSDLVPTPGTGWQQFVNALLHWEIAGLVIVDIMGFKVGFSPAHYFGEGASFLDSSVLTGDLFVSMPPSGGDRSKFKLRGLNGEKVAFPIEGIGWRLGGFHLEGVALPDGVVITLFRFSLIISELGIRAEDGASYLSFSGGLGFEQPAGIAAAITVKGLRFRVAGNPDAPSTKLDGFFLVVRGPSFAGEGGGYYRELTVGGVDVSELGFSVSLTLTLAPGKRYVFGVDGIVGDASGPTGQFDYFMFQAYYVGAIGPLAAFELTGARALYARNMLPALREVDREARELRYLKWYQDTNPLTVPGDRRLAAWRPEKDSWTLGVGASASLPGLGKVVELTVFALVVRGGSEKGLLIVAEVRALGSNRPFGYAAIEFDQRNDRVSFMVGVDVRLSTFVKQAPAWMDGIGALTGTLFISNDPSTFAIGRLADQNTWLGVRFGVDLWLQSAVVIAFCFERVEGGPNGFALCVRVEGGIGKKGVVRLSYNVGWSLLVVVFSTGSTDYAMVIGIEAGIRFTLFGFLKIGVSASMTFRVVGGRPARGELTAQIKLETPWFLPDVTWRFDVQFGELRPDQLSTAVQPLRSAGALDPATRAQLPTHIERFDESWNGEGVAPVHSVAELRAPTRPEAAAARESRGEHVHAADRHGLDDRGHVGRPDQRQARFRRRRGRTGAAIRRPATCR